jgi:hypothetical protein
MGSELRQSAIQGDSRRSSRFPTGCIFTVLICWISWIPSAVHSALPAGMFLSRFIFDLFFHFFISYVEKSWLNLTFCVIEIFRDILTWNSSWGEREEVEASDKEEEKNTHTQSSSSLFLVNVNVSWGASASQAVVSKPPDVVSSFETRESESFFFHPKSLTHSTNSSDFFVQSEIAPYFQRFKLKDPIYIPKSLMFSTILRSCWKETNFQEHSNRKRKKK